jgi:Zn-dependent protease with chaperone function
MSRVLVVAIVLLASGCAGLDERAYYPPDGPRTRALAETLYRAAQAAGDDPARYSFAMLASRDVVAFSADDATFYFSEGLARQPAEVIEALVAHEVAHEVLGHAGQRRTLSLALSAGFTVFGILVPGAGLLDFVVNPLVVRAFTRDQEIAADLRALEILRMMGHPSPQRTLADALRAAHAINGNRAGGWLASEPSLEHRLAALGPPRPVDSSGTPGRTPR